MVQEFRTLLRLQSVSWGCSNLKAWQSLEDLFLRKLVHMAVKFMLVIGRTYLISVPWTSPRSFLSALITFSKASNSRGSKVETWMSFMTVLSDLFSVGGNYTREWILKIRSLGTALEAGFHGFKSLPYAKHIYGFQWFPQFHLFTATGLKYRILSSESGPGGGRHLGCSSLTIAP